MIDSPGRDDGRGALFPVQPPLAAWVAGAPAVGVQPHDLAAERNGIGEQSSIGGERRAQAGSHEVILRA